MKAFMDEDFILNTDTAKRLYHSYAENMPIIDYHCHIPAEEIAKDITFKNITQLWLGADHYKWRFMRTMGVEEKYITGNASDKEKFLKWATCLGKAIGNPLFAWSHLELKRYFGYDGILCEATAEEVWELCNNVLSSPSMSSKNIIKKSNVDVVCTTDDPVDSLEWHLKIKEDKSFKTQVLPSFRPDNAVEIGKSTYNEYIKQLSAASGIDIIDLNSLKQSLVNRLEHFVNCGCKVTDHGLFYVMYKPCNDSTADSILQKKLSGQAVSYTEELEFKTNILLFLCREYKKRDLVLQLHYGCKRDNNEKMFNRIGANTGFDCISSYTPADELTDFLSALDITDELPKTILYSLNPADNQMIGSIVGCFQNSDAIVKVQQGSAWWFNDNRVEMKKQLISFANLSSLAGFVGMLTDSRSFLSYTRHEYFRRILCNLIGDFVENGEYPDNDKLLSEIISDISYNNAKRYFNF